MARNQSKKEETKQEFKEFDITAAHQNTFEGRLYLEPHCTAKGRWHRVSLTINGISIRGVKLWVPNDDNKDITFLFPSYETKDGKSESYIVFFNKDDRDDMLETAAKLEEML